jgi:metal-dependent hydrolase (beta-lactamase superfamily II)
LEPDGGGGHVRMSKSLMQDALHPTEKGMAVLAGCIKEGIANVQRQAAGSGGKAGKAGAVVGDVETGGIEAGAEGVLR